MNERELSVRILTNLSTLREDMLALIDTIWDNINPRDADRRNAGNGQVDILDAQLKRLGDVEAEVADLLKHRVGLTEEELPGNKPGVATTTADPAFAGRLAHTVDEDLTGTKPIGFTFNGEAVKGMTDWAEVYAALCKDIAQRDPARFRALADNPQFVTSRGNLLFSLNPEHFGQRKLIVDNVYVDVQLSVRSVFSRLRKLFTEFGVPVDALRVYLRRELAGE